MSTSGSALEHLRGAVGGRRVGGDALEPRLGLLGAQLGDGRVDTRRVAAVDRHGGTGARQAVAAIARPMPCVDPLTNAVLARPGRFSSLSFPEFEV